MRWIIFLLLLGSLTNLSAKLPSGYRSLFLGRNTSPEVEKVAGQLADFLEMEYADRPEVRRLPMIGRPEGILITPDPGNSHFDLNPLTDEILIDRTRDGLRISGTDNSSTCFAIYRFIEEFLGWRYFAPGELGLERLDSPPEPPASQGATGILLYEKAHFYSRNLSGMGEAGHQIDWRLWHGLRERFVYNHTLQQTLEPQLFGQHPDWFAKDQNGQPEKPPYDYPHGYNDHPDLTHPEVRAHVVQKTVKALQDALRPRPSQSIYPPVRQSPGIISTSISLGDSFVFGHFPDSYAWKPNRYYRRWPDWGNHVFDYSNAVAREISKQWNQLAMDASDHSRLYIGALSYLNWENVPDFNVQANIVPYLTFDRSQWYDPKARASDLDLVAKWAANGPQFLGTWDYLFGYGFLMPRSLISIVSESIPALYDQGVRAYFSQVAAIWPYDAHTNYLTARLLWNPQANPENLMDEFFDEYYGPASAEMRAFFSTAEATWMKQKDDGWWLRYWKDPWQAALWTDSDLLRMQELLEQALAKCSNYDTESRDTNERASRFYKRIQQTARLFDLTRIFVDYQQTCWELQTHPWETASRKPLREGLKTAQRCLAVREELTSKTAQFAGNSTLLRHTRDLDWIFRYDSVGPTIAAIKAQLKFLESGGSSLPGKSVLKDTRFGNIDDPRIWHHQFMDAEGQSRYSPDEGRGYVVEATRRGHVYQLFKAKPEKAYLGFLDLETLQSPTGEVYLEIDFYSSDHKQLEKSSRSRIAPTKLFGEKQRIRVFMEAPASSAYGRIKIRFYELDPQSRVKLNRIDVLELDR